MTGFLSKLKARIPASCQFCALFNTFPDLIPSANPKYYLSSTIGFEPRRQFFFWSIIYLNL